jgi:peptide methionine sulfoxide reductase MsrB
VFVLFPFTHALNSDGAHVVEREDLSHDMERTEVIDVKSGAHLGHVYDDDSTQTGRRYCINAAVLQFVPRGEGIEMLSTLKPNDEGLDQRTTEGVEAWSP